MFPQAQLVCVVPVSIEVWDVPATFTHVCHLFQDILGRPRLFQTKSMHGHHGFLVQGVPFVSGQPTLSLHGIWSVGITILWSKMTHLSQDKRDIMDLELVMPKDYVRDVQGSTDGAQLS